MPPLFTNEHNKCSFAVYRIVPFACEGALKYIYPHVPGHMYSHFLNAFYVFDQRFIDMVFTFSSIHMGAILSLTINILNPVHHQISLPVT